MAADLAAIEAALETTFSMMTAHNIAITAEKTEVVGDLAYEVGD